MTGVVTDTMAPAEAIPSAAPDRLSRSRRADQRRRLLIAAVTLVTIRVGSGLVLSKAALSSVPQGPWFPPVHGWTAPFIRWDANYFTAIAQHGYSWLETFDFFPLYPLLIRTLSPVFGYAGGALAVSWIASVFAVWGVMDVTERFTSRRMAWVAGALLVWNPLSVFLLAGYAEALLVALMIWSLRFCLDEKWWPAAVTAGLASGVLPQGIASAVVLVVAVLLVDRTARGVLKSMGFGLVGLAGCIAYLLYCWADTGNPLKIRDAETAGWQAHLTYPFHMVFLDLSRMASWHFTVGTTDVSSQMRAVYAFDAGIGLFAAAVVVAGVVLCRTDRRLVLPTVLLGVGVLISVITVDAAADSTARFMLFLAPLYVIVAVVLHRLPAVVRLPVVLKLVILAAAGAVFFGMLFNLGYWLT
jgi:hypothetical protein